MKKLLLLTTFLMMAILMASTVQAQTRNPNVYEPGKRAQNVYFELFGSGLAYSFNYDTRFQNTLNGLGGRIGVSYFATDGSTFFSVPVGLNYLLGKDGRYFEMGAGATFVSLDFGNDEEGDYNGEDEFLFLEGKSSNVVGTMTFGYRRQPIDGGFNFRAGVSPVFGSGNFIPWWPYIGFGYSF